MNHEKTKKSRSAPSGGIIAWLYELLFPPKNTAADESSISPARETIPEHDSGRAEKLFAQMQENETTMPRVVHTSSATTTRAAHQDDGTTSSAFHHHAAADGGSSSSSCDSDSGSSGCD